MVFEYLWRSSPWRPAAAAAGYGCSPPARARLGDTGLFLKNHQVLGRWPHGQAYPLPPDSNNRIPPVEHEATSAPIMNHSRCAEVVLQPTEPEALRAIATLYLAQERRQSASDNHRAFGAQRQ